jgi:hypothetical protein
MTDDQAAALSRISTSIKIAEALGEIRAKPKKQIRKIVKHCGVEQALAWLEEAERIEAAGGQMIRGGSRRRTKGGIFFRLVRDSVKPELLPILFSPILPAEELKKIRKRKAAKRLSGKPQAAQQPPPPPSEPELPQVTWDNRDSLISEGQQEVGKATNVKITVIGRPSKAVERQGFTLVVMEHEGKVASLPKGIPLPPQPLPTQYIVYIASKQWKKVKESIASPEDILIVEGVPVLDPKFLAITVFATNTTTRLLQQSKRASSAQKDQREETHAENPAEARS